MRSIGIICLLILGLCLSSSAQSFLGWQYNDRYFSVNVGSGKVGYSGDLSHDRVFQPGLASASVGVEARLLSRVSARFEARWFNISGSDSRAEDDFGLQRNLSFRSSNIEIELSGMYYFLNAYQGMYYKRKPIDPYVSLGAGLVFYNPKTDLDGTTYTLRDYSTEGRNYGGSAFIIPVGIGAKLSLNEFVNLIPEFGYRVTFTDYLDDVSGRYGGPYNDPIAAALSNRKDEVGVINQSIYDQLVPGAQRGDEASRDSYYMITVKLEVYLPPDLFVTRGSKHSKQKLYKKPSAFDKK
ncbi:MAG: hypothetical protein AAGC88_06450 [Bacteroidota bacterium]